MPLTERLSSRVAAEALALAGSEPRGVPAVIDTNVVLDLIYWEDPHSEDLRRALEEGRIHALRSGEAVMELAEVLSRPAFTGDEDEAARLAALWCSMSVPVDEEKIREAADVITVQCRDPLDQKFFTLTLAGGAKLLVSKDKSYSRPAARCSDTAPAPSVPKRRRRGSTRSAERVLRHGNDVDDDPEGHHGEGDVKRTAHELSQHVRLQKNRGRKRPIILAVSTPSEKPPFRVPQSRRDHLGNTP